MSPPASPQDTQQLSAYLDNQLPQKARTQLEARLRASATLRDELTALRRTRQILRAAPPLKAPRSFALTPQMVASPRASLFNFARYTFALSSLLFIVSLVGGMLNQPGGVSLASIDSASQPEMDFAEEAASVADMGEADEEMEVMADEAAPAFSEDTAAQAVPFDEADEEAEAAVALDEDGEEADAAPEEDVEEAAIGDEDEGVADAGERNPEEEEEDDDDDDAANAGAVTTEPEASVTPQPAAPTETDEVLGDPPPAPGDETNLVEGETVTGESVSSGVRAFPWWGAASLLGLLSLLSGALFFYQRYRQRGKI